MNTRIIHAHALDALRTMPDKSVHCCISSPPYWGLRSYGTEPQIWGGDQHCNHQWMTSPSAHRAKPTRKTSAMRHSSTSQAQAQATIEEPSDFCGLCGAWRGEHGLEPTMELWIANAVSIFAEIHRVLRDDGTLWINIGDTYATDQNGRPAAAVRTLQTDDRSFRDKPFSTATAAIPSKNRLMLPARLAIALQDAGWYCRDELIWFKPNPMPSSARDRTCPAHEMVYLLAKQPRYYFDDIAILEDSSPKTRPGRKDGKTINPIDGGNGFDRRPGTLHRSLRPTKRMRRSVWSINPEPCRDAHFATFPTKLILPMIEASTSEVGVCVHCGAPFQRISRKETDPSPADPAFVSYSYITTGWRPSCNCRNPKPVPATVLDPFGGTGTVGSVSNSIGRDAILIELNADYVDIARNRLETAGYEPAVERIRSTKPECRGGPLDARHAGMGR